MDFESLKDLFYKGKLQEYVNICNKLEENQQFYNFSDNQRIILLYFKNHIFARFKECDGSLKLSETLRKSLNDKKSKFYEFGAQIIQITISYHCLLIDKSDIVPKFDEIDSFINSLNSEDKTDFSFFIGTFYLLKGSVFNNIPKFDMVLECYQNALKIFLSLKDQYSIALTRNHMGYFFAVIGEEDQSIESRTEALKLAKENNFLYLKYSGYFNLGYSLKFIGNYEKALEFSLKSQDLIDLFDQSNPDYPIESNALHNIGEIYRKIGELDLALEYLQRALVIAESKKLLSHIAESTSEIGELYRQNGNISLAKKYLVKGLEIWKTSGHINDIYKSHNLFYLVRLGFDMDDTDFVKKYLNQMKELEKNTLRGSPKLILQTYIPLTNALLLRESRRMVDKVEAQKILSDLGLNPVLNFEVTAYSMVLLCETLIEEYKVFFDPAVLEEARNLVQRLFNLCETNNAYPIMIKSLILKSKFSVLNNELEMSFEYLDQAKRIAEEKKLFQLLEKITFEKETIGEQFTKAQKLIQSNASIQEQIENTKLESYLKDVEKLMDIKGK